MTLNGTGIKCLLKMIFFSAPVVTITEIYNDSDNINPFIRYASVHKAVTTHTLEAASAALRKAAMSPHLA